MYLRTDLGPAVSFGLQAKNCMHLQLRKKVIFSDAETSASDVQFSTRGHSYIFNEGKFLNNVQLAVYTTVLAATWQAEKCRIGFTSSHICQHCASSGTLHCWPVVHSKSSACRMFQADARKTNSQSVHTQSVCCGQFMTRVNLGLKGSVSSS